MENSRSKKIIPILMIIVSLIVIIISVWFIFRKGTGQLSLVIAPASSGIIIDDKEYSGGSEISLEAGTHELRIEKFGFSTHTEQIEIKKSETTTVYVALEPTIAITQKWYDLYPEDAKLKATIDEKNREIDYKKIVSAYPGIEKLPYTGESFRLSYVKCIPVQFYENECVLISAKSKEASLSAIDYFRKNIDSKLGQYYFTYHESSNPFFDGTYELDSVPAPTKEIDGYGAVIFELDGHVYRALYIIVNDEYVLSGYPAPVLNYNSFMGVPEEVIDQINEMELR